MTLPAAQLSPFARITQLLEKEVLVSPDSNNSEDSIYYYNKFHSWLRYDLIKSCAQLAELKSRWPQHFPAKLFDGNTEYLNWLIRRGELNEARKLINSGTPQNSETLLCALRYATRSFQLGILQWCNEVTLRGECYSGGTYKCLIFAAQYCDFLVINALLQREVFVDKAGLVAIVRAILSRGDLEATEKGEIAMQVVNATDIEIGEAWVKLVGKYAPKEIWIMLWHHGVMQLNIGSIPPDVTKNEEAWCSEYRNWFYEKGYVQIDAWLFAYNKELSEEENIKAKIRALKELRARNYLHPECNLIDATLCRTNDHHFCDAIAKQLNLKVQDPESVLRSFQTRSGEHTKDMLLSLKWLTEHCADALRSIVLHEPKYLSANEWKNKHLYGYMSAVFDDMLFTQYINDDNAQQEPKKTDENSTPTAP